MSVREIRARATPLLALFLLLPAPSLGVLFGMVLLPGTAMGQGIFMCSKIWILLVPSVWFFWVEKGTLQRGKTAPGGFRVGLFSGLAITAFIVLIYLLVGRPLIDPEHVHGMAEKIGLADRRRYLLGALYWLAVNSVLEEYVWRWFVVRQFERLVGARWAVVASALGFTVHHAVALQVYFTPLVTTIATVWIAVGGAWWSWMYLRYKTIWPGWLSHALVDLTIFTIGYGLIFG